MLSDTLPPTSQIHSLANGPEVQKPLLETSRKVGAERHSSVNPGLVVMREHGQGNGMHMDIGPDAPAVWRLLVVVVVVQCC